MLRITTILLISVITSFAVAETQYDIFKDEIELAREIISKERSDVVIKNMRLTVFDEKKFMGTYNIYRDDMKPILDKEVKLLTDYADAYVKHNLSDEQALNFATTLLELKSQKIALRKNYINKFKEILSSKHAARFIQLENKLDTLVHYELMQIVPLVPANK